MSVQTELWAQNGVEDLLTPYVKAPQPFTMAEVEALVRAAYGNGYMAALSEPAPLPILEAGRRAEALRLMLPVA